MLKLPIRSLRWMSVMQPMAIVSSRFSLSEPLANPPAGFTINTPPRIALDFPARKTVWDAPCRISLAEYLRSANIVQVEARTRLVINLNQMLADDTRLDGNTVLITLHGKVADQASVTSRFADAEQGAQKHSLSNVDFRRASNGAGRAAVHQHRLGRNLQPASPPLVCLQAAPPLGAGGLGAIV